MVYIVFFRGPIAEGYKIAQITCPDNVSRYTLEKCKIYFSPVRLGTNPYVQGVITGIFCGAFRGFSHLLATPRRLQTPRRDSNFFHVTPSGVATATPGLGTADLIPNDR